MSDLTDKILALTKQLFPTGRAWKMPAGGYLEKLHVALMNSEQQGYLDAVSILYDILPDNANFTSDDATDWERRLGLITNLSTTLSDRMLAIKNKLNQPGKNPAKQNWMYLHEQLNNSGFDVFVYENKFLEYPQLDYITKSPIDITGDTSLLTNVEHGDFQHGDAQHGGNYNNKVVNNITDSKDLLFDFGGDFKNTFFIGGTPIGTHASVPKSRHDEFRQLILKTKPVQTIGFLFINYI